MFKWDGTDVTDLVSECDIFEAIYNKTIYWIIKNQDITEYCLVRNGNTTVCLSDELKSLFGLKKVGTHWLKYQNKIKILIKPTITPEGYIKEEINLKSIQAMNDLTILQIQEIFAFRELLGITCSYISSLVWRENGNLGYPLSYYEPNMNPDDKKVIPITILDKFFKGTSLTEVIRRLIKIKKIEALPKVSFKLGTNIEQIIYRVDRNLIEYKTCILSRITQRLQSTLEHIE